MTPTTIPWTPDDDQARRLLDERIEAFDVEAEAMSWWERALNWLAEALRFNVDAAGVGGILVQLLLVALVAVFVILLVRYFRPSSAAQPAADAEQLADPSVSAEQYVQQAQQALETEHFDQAFLQAYRAMVRTAAQRRFLDVTPATTATVFGWQLGAMLPTEATAIENAAAEFNATYYGGATPSRHTAEQMLQLAHRIATAPPPSGGAHPNPARLMPR